MEITAIGLSRPRMP